MYIWFQHQLRVLQMASNHVVMGVGGGGGGGVMAAPVGSIGVGVGAIELQGLVGVGEVGHNVHDVGGGNYRDPNAAPLRKLSVDLIKTYKRINEVGFHLCGCIN